MASPLRWPVATILSGIVLIGVAALMLAAAFQGFAQDFQAPGETVLKIPEPGQYRLWQYARVHVDGAFRQFPDRLPDGTRIHAEHLADGTRTELQPTNMGMTFQSGQTERIAIGTLTFSQPGRHALRLEGLDAPRAFSLREARFLQHARRVGAFLVPGGLLFVTGIVWLIIVTSARPARGREPQ